MFGFNKNSTTSGMKVDLIGGQFYNKDLYAKTFTVGQIQSLAQCIVTDDEINLIRLIGETLIDFDVEELYDCDFKYLSYWQRINSFSNYPHIITWDCPHCKQENETPLTTDVLKYIDIKPDYNDKLKIRLTNFKDPIKIRMPKVKDYIKVYNFMKRNQWPSQDKIKKKLLRNLMMLSDDPSMSSIDKLWSLVKDDKFSNDDFMSLELFKREFNWGVENSIDAKCVGCGKEVSVEYTFSLTSFLPSDYNRRYFRENLLVSEVPEPTTD